MILSFRPQIYDESETDQILNAKYFFWKKYTLGKLGSRKAFNQNSLMQLFNGDRRIVQWSDSGPIKKQYWLGLGFLYSVSFFPKVEVLNRCEWVLAPVYKKSLSCTGKAGKAATTIVSFRWRRTYCIATRTKLQEWIDHWAESVSYKQNLRGWGIF